MEANTAHPKNSNDAAITIHGNMSPDLIEKASSIFGVAAVVLTALAAFAGCFAWYFAAKTSSAKDDAFKRFKEDSRVAIASADASAANALAKAASANERAAKLEKEAAEARLELAKIDPLNLPIRSIRADIFLIVRGDFFDWHFDKNPVVKEGARGVNVSLNGKDGALVILRCNQFESFVWAEEGKPNGRTFSMSCVWPTGDWFEAQDIVKYWIDRNNASTSTLDTEMVAAVISIPPTKENSAEILQSSFVVTINGSIRRKFSVPKNFETRTGIICVPIKD